MFDVGSGGGGGGGGAQILTNSSSTNTTTHMPNSIDNSWRLQIPKTPNFNQPRKSIAVSHFKEVTFRDIMFRAKWPRQILLLKKKLTVRANINDPFPQGSKTQDTGNIRGHFGKRAKLSPCVVGFFSFHVFLVAKKSKKLLH